MIDAAAQREADVADVEYKNAKKRSMMLCGASEARGGAAYSTAIIIGKNERRQFGK